MKPPEPLVLALAFVFGMAFGSFANVAVYRVPRGFSVVSPGSLCPGCERPIVWYDNIPLASYLILRARCRNCGVRISLRYPVVEVFTGLAWAAMVWRIGLHPELPAYLAFATALVLILSRSKALASALSLRSRSATSLRSPGRLSSLKWLIASPI